MCQQCGCLNETPPVVSRLGTRAVEETGVYARIGVQREDEVALNVLQENEVSVVSHIGRGPTGPTGPQGPPGLGVTIVVVPEADWPPAATEEGVLYLKEAT